MSSGHSRVLKVAMSGLLGVLLFGPLVAAPSIDMRVWGTIYAVGVPILVAYFSARVLREKAVRAGAE